MPTIPFISIDPLLLNAATAFLFVFAIVFALLTYTKLFVHKDKAGSALGKEPRGVYAAISLVMGIAAVSYEPLTLFLQQIMPPIIILLVIIFFVVFVKEIFRKKGDKEAHPLQSLSLLAILLVLLGAFWSDISALTGVSSFISSENLFVLVAVVIIVLIFYVVSKVKEGEK